VLPLISDLIILVTQYIYEVFVQVAAAETVTGCFCFIKSLATLCCITIQIILIIKIVLQFLLLNKSKNLYICCTTIYTFFLFISGMNTGLYLPK